MIYLYHENYDIMNLLYILYIFVFILIHILALRFAEMFWTEQPWPGSPSTKGPIDAAQGLLIGDDSSFGYSRLGL